MYHYSHRKLLISSSSQGLTLHWNFLNSFWDTLWAIRQTNRMRTQLLWMLRIMMSALSQRRKTSAVWSKCCSCCSKKASRLKTHSTWGGGSGKKKKNDNKTTIYHRVHASSEYSLRSKSSISESQTSEIIPNEYQHRKIIHARKYFFS